MRNAARARVCVLCIYVCKMYGQMGKINKLPHLTSNLLD